MMLFMDRLPFSYAVVQLLLLIQLSLHCVRVRVVLPASKASIQPPTNAHNLALALGQLPNLSDTKVQQLCTIAYTFVCVVKCYEYQQSINIGTGRTSLCVISLCLFVRPLQTWIPTMAK